MIGDIIDRLLERRRGAKCMDHGPEVPEGHDGFHKSHMIVWPNAAESKEKWAAVGRRLMAGEPMPHLSLREIEFYVGQLVRGESRAWLRERLPE